MTLGMRAGKQKRVVPVESLQDASQKWCAVRDASGKGASECLPITVVDLDTGKTIARISYNGRIWSMDGQEITGGSCAS
jgi:hypothetical protein